MMCKNEIQQKIEEIYDLDVVNIKIKDKCLRLEKGGVSRIGFEIYVETSSNLFTIQMFFDDEFNFTFGKNIKEITDFYDLRRYFKSEQE